jgi:DNA-binding protein HU-beta
VDVLGAQLGIDRPTARVRVDALFELISRALASGDHVTVSGFGRFDTVRRGTRTARHPRTGKLVTIAPTIVPRFRAEPAFKAEVAAQRKARSSAERVGRGRRPKKEPAENPTPATPPRPKRRRMPTGVAKKSGVSPRPAPARPRAKL